MPTALESTQPADETGHTLILRKCVFRRGYVAARGDSETMSIIDAVRRLAPSGTRSARNNVLRARTGHYIGVMSDSTSFVFKNSTNDGDIRWLIQKKPDFESRVKEIYLVEDCIIVKNIVDLPGDPERIP